MIRTPYGQVLCCLMFCLAGCNAMDGRDADDDVMPEFYCPAFQDCAFESACVLGDPSLIIRTSEALGDCGDRLCEVRTEPCAEGTVCAYLDADGESCSPNQAACVAVADVCGGPDQLPCSADHYCELTALACALDSLYRCATDIEGEKTNTCTYAAEGGYGVCRLRPSSCPETADPVLGCDGSEYLNNCERQAAGANSDSCYVAGATVFSPPTSLSGGFSAGYSLSQSESATHRGGFSANFGAGILRDPDQYYVLSLGARAHLRGSQ